MKNKKDYVMTKPNPTLTQSGLLAVLLQHQRRKAIELVRRRAQRKEVRAAFWSNLTSLWARAHSVTAGGRFHRRFGESVPRHT